jgi:hypothetical protein
MVKGWDTEKIILMCLVVMAIFDDTGCLKVSVGQENGFWRARGSGSEIQARLIFNADFNIGVYCAALR